MCKPSLLDVDFSLMGTAELLSQLGGVESCQSVANGCLLGRCATRCSSQRGMPVVIPSLNHIFEPLTSPTRPEICPRLLQQRPKSMFLFSSKFGEFSSFVPALLLGKPVLPY